VLTLMFEKSLLMMVTPPEWKPGAGCGLVVP